MENKTITIGRDKNCDVVIPDTKANAKVSGKHATIKSVKQDDGWTNGFLLEDHSTNGTYVNSKLILNGTYYIQKGDIITLGKDYVLDWDSILPLFEGRPTNTKPDNLRKTQKKAANNNQQTYSSSDPVYPDPISNIVEKPRDEENEPPKNSFVFTGKHWLITAVAFIIGLLVGAII